MVQWKGNYRLTCLPGFSNGCLSGTAAGFVNPPDKPERNSSC